MLLRWAAYGHSLFGKGECVERKIATILLVVVFPVRISVASFAELSKSSRKSPLVRLPPVSRRGLAMIFTAFHFYILTLNSRML